MSEETIYIGIIGCGVIAPVHIESYLQIPQVEVVALCDPLTERMQSLSERFPEQTFQHFASLEDLLSHEKLNAVSICTDHGSHASIMKRAVEAGLHVLCEKPLCAHPEQLQSMVDAARHTRQTIGAVFQHRFDPIYCALKSTIEQGEFGKILNVSAQHSLLRTPSYYKADAWRGTLQQEGGSLLINQSIHYLDIIHWVSGGIDSIAAFSANQTHEQIIETEDAVSCSLSFESGALGTFLATASSPLGWEIDIRVVGTDGDVHLRNEELVGLRHVDEQRQEKLQKVFTGADVVEGTHAGRGYYGKGHPSQLADFIDSIREGRPPTVDIFSAAETMQLVFGVYASSRSGKRFDLHAD